MKILLFILGMMFGGTVAVIFMCLLQAANNSHVRIGENEEKKYKVRSPIE